MISLRGRIEGLLFASHQPLKVDTIAELLNIENSQIQKVIKELQEAYSSKDHGFELIKVAGGFQFRTQKELKELMSRLYERKPPRISQANLEVLAVIGYKQPITRPEIEKIRGVDCTGVLKTLLERELIEMKGRTEGPGNPVIYATTDKFLEWFQITALEELPPLSEIEALNVVTNEGAENLLGLLNRDDGFQPEGVAEMDQTLKDVSRANRQFNATDTLAPESTSAEN